jgi:hypothetical protein
MPSPFPGMDPYLEGYLWPDVHHALASKIRQLLVPQLSPNYLARLEVSVFEDKNPEGEVGILYPDVEILRAKSRSIATPQPTSSVTTSSVTTSGTAIVTTPVLTMLPLLEPMRVKIVTVEIRDTVHHRLITSIEILLPVNKREPNLSQYRAKRQRLYDANVHQLELDLIRRGTRPIQHPSLPDSLYLVTLTRSQTRAIEVWGMNLKDTLPIVPIPLQNTDPDAVLDLGQALREIYEEAAYDLSIDYTETPPPPVLPID